MRRVLPITVAAVGLASVSAFWLATAMVGALVARVIGFLLAGQ